MRAAHAFDPPTRPVSGVPVRPTTELVSLYRDTGRVGGSPHLLSEVEQAGGRSFNEKEPFLCEKSARRREATHLAACRQDTVARDD